MVQSVQEEKELLMDRLIKLSDAIEAVWKPQVKPNELIFDALKQAIESEIRNCPTAEAVQISEIYDAGYSGEEVRFYIGGRLFAVRELPQ